MGQNSENSPAGKAIDPNGIVVGDCVKVLGGLAPEQADLVFADPPFNIGYKHDLYEDRKAYGDYHAWTREWMAACSRILKPTDLFYWTKDPKSFTFNDGEVRIPSARQTTYADRRANPKGKIPDDVWSFSRVCGTFNERVRWHPCQMPERVLERIVRVCSNPSDLVIDPFNGSGTTCCVAARLGRRCFAIDISQKHVNQSRRRIVETLAGKRLTTEISEDPEALRPLRKVGGKRQGRRRKQDRSQPALFAQS